jgi:hypothetical protein
MERKRQRWRKKDGYLLELAMWPYRSRSLVVS